MSFKADGPHTWYWTGVEIPRVGVNFGFVDSPDLCYKEAVWYLRCNTSMDGNTYLGLYLLRAPDGPLSYFTVSLLVWDGHDAEPGCSQFSQVSDKCGRSNKIIWKQKISELERIVPGFSQDRLVSFRIKIIEDKDPQTGPSHTRTQTSTKTSRQRPKRRPKTFAEASVQTNLASDSNHCLDALSADFAKMLDAGSDLDVKILCEGYSTRAHKDVLCSRSPVLEKMLQCDMVEGRTREINIRDMDADTFQRFLRYLYTGRLEDALTFDAAMSLYEAGDLYGVESLARRCSQFLIQNLKVDNACDVLAVADMHSDKEFAERVTVFILEKKMPMSNDGPWLAFSDSHPKLANNVYRRFCTMFCK